MAYRSINDNDNDNGDDEAGTSNTLFCITINSESRMEVKGHNIKPLYYRVHGSLLAIYYIAMIGLFAWKMDQIYDNYLVFLWFNLYMVYAAIRSIEFIIILKAYNKKIYAKMATVLMKMLTIIYLLVIMIVEDDRRNIALKMAFGVLLGEIIIDVISVVSSYIIGMVLY